MKPARIPAVSILMTAYNRENFIGDAIKSVLASTFTDFELIIVDDKSTDRTAKIASEYAKKDPRIQVHINDINLGDYPNRNRAASFAKGAYIKFVDSDDLIYPWGLQILVATMEAHPTAGYGLCSIEQDAERIFPFQLSPEEAYLRHYRGKYIFHKAPLSSIIRRSAFRNVQGFSGARMIGDMELWHRLSSKYPVVLMPHGLVWYRDHSGGESQIVRDNLWMQLRYVAKSFEYFRAHCPDLDAADRTSIFKHLRTRQARFILKSLLSEPRAFAEINRERNIGWLDVLRYCLPSF